MKTFKELFLESKTEIAFSGSKTTVDKLMEELQNYEEKNGFPFQGYMSYTKDYKTYVVEIDNLDLYKKNKKWFDKIIEKYKRF